MSMLLRGLRLFPLLSLLALTPVLFAQRLPAGAHPDHYSLKLTPDLKTATFSGDETLDLTLDHASKTVTLNAIEIQFKSVAAGSNAATVTVDEAKQQATFTFAQELPAGKNSIHIEYTGILNNELRGFYLSKTAKRNYAVTQFEATDARRAFPSFDEPALKATFDTTLVIDDGDTGISNTNIVSDTPAGTGKHAVKFATTPKMSTYLVAFIVGDFKCVEGRSDGVPIRACATPDKVEYGKFAVEAAEQFLHYYNQYFGIAYPLPKLDMIALPDFEAGAMENFGAITYRETALLVDENTASYQAKKNVAYVVAHEMAHQWFGDMVTMQWWDNLWLNEGFATWMEFKPVNAWKPEWHITEDQAAGLDNTLNLDAQKRTRTIRAKVDTPDEINEMFDGITYGKAGAVIGMVEHYVGEETFRQGVHNYLAAHIYGNATAEDFWGAQTRASGKPIDRVMSSFVAQPGVPLLLFATPRDNKVGVSQQRFFDVPNAGPAGGQVWTVPSCLKFGGAAACSLIAQKTQDFPVAKKATMFFANEAAKGYYRSEYSPTVYQSLVGGVEVELTPEERIILQGDEWALMLSGRGNISDFLSLVEPLSHDDSGVVLTSLAVKLQTIDEKIATDADRKLLAAWVRAVFEPVYERLRVVKASDSLDVKEKRATLFVLLGMIGRDPAIIAEAKELANRWTKDPTAIEPSLADAALDIATAYGDGELFDKLQQLYKTSPDPQVRTKSLYLLANFHDPMLVQRGYAYAVSGEVRNQDAVGLFSRPMSSRDTRPVAWQYVQKNWDKVHAQLTMLSGNRLVQAAGSFCSADARQEVNSFFSTHQVESSERALQRANDAIDACIALRATQEPQLAKWLAAHTPEAAQ
jgi:aminopeptidase N/puromycin-sensitive aminopeptidase